MQFKCYTPRPS